MYIYLIRNKESGKCYVGQTTQQPDRRFKGHLSMAKRVLEGRSDRRMLIANAINKHGLDAFSRHILEICPTREKLGEAEDRWIKFYNSLAPNGYNLRAGGLHNNGAGVSEETRQRMRESAIRRGSVPMSSETRRKMSESKRGRKFTPEHREKLSKAHSNVRLSELHISKAAEARRAALTASGRHGNPKLDWELVRRIRAESQVESIKNLADKYGIHYATVNRLINFKSWVE